MFTSRFIILLIFLHIFGALSQNSTTDDIDTYAPSTDYDDYSGPAIVSDTGVSCASYMYNPCGAGTCIDQEKTVTCICPRGYEVAYRANGSPLCFLGANVKIYEVSPNDTCYLIATTFRMTVDDLIQRNPSLDCNSSLPVKKILNVVPVKPVTRCRTYYTVQEEDSCASIENFFGLGTNALVAMNPDLNCNQLVTYQTVCIQENKNREKSFLCARYAPTNAASTCYNMAKNNGMTLNRLFLMNQGLACSSLNKTPRKFCVLGVPRSSLRCVKRVYVANGDTCKSLIKDYYMGSFRKFRKMNRGFVCDDFYLYVGMSLC